jgi:hypothetical protein
MGNSYSVCFFWYIKDYFLYSTANFVYTVYLLLRSISAPLGGWRRAEVD